MNRDPRFDRLVDEITRRVQGRLEQRSSRSVRDDPGVAGQTPGRVPAGSGEPRRCVGRPHDSAVAQTVARDIASLIDHTLLKPEVSHDELRTLCDEARTYEFATVCVNSANVKFCSEQLAGSRVRPIAVVGFPLGATTPAAKAFEAREAIRDGAAEIDMVIQVGALRGKDYALVLDDIRAVVRESAPVPVKVILETGLLDHDQKVAACVLSKVAGAAFVKTSTGFGPGGATVEDIRLMRRIVGPEMGVKASGGLRTQEDARVMIEAGANRLGASASVAIVTGKGAGRAAAGQGRGRAVGR